MLWYTVKRILLFIPIVMCVILIVYALLYTTVGANQRALSSYGGGDWLDRFFDRLGIQETFFSRYLRYCYNVIFRLDFGVNRGTSRDISSELLWRVGHTLQLAGLAFLIATVFGVILGMAAATHRNGPADNVLMFFITFLSSVPSYTLALILVLLFAVRLKWLPAYGFTRPGWIVMPAISLSVGGVASTARITRASAIEVLDQPYVTALRAKGLKERRVLYVHVLRNALLPVIANLGTVLSQLVCGSMVVERFFSLVGIGYALLNAVASRDNFTVLGISVVIAVMLTAVNILTDLLYVAVNPQVRAQYVGGRGRRHEA